MSTEQHIYITDIYIKELRHLKDVNIPITTPEKGLKHLILTGKNGSGKTSLLNKISDYLDDLSAINTELAQIAKVLGQTPNSTKLKRASLESAQQRFNNVGRGVELILTNTKVILENLASGVAANYDNSYCNYITVFFPAKRAYTPQKPLSVQIVELPESSKSAIDTSQQFLNYLVFLRTKLANASYSNNQEEVARLENWFKRFSVTLKKIFNDPGLYLEFDSNKLNFIIHQSGHKPFDFNTLPDGYATVLRIVTELMLRMEAKGMALYDTKGIVLIDEIEAHLHIELQKQILPFLTGLFPNIQFIVTSHSPFILNSIENAVVYDLENHILFEDASELSVSGLVENYFLIKSDYSALMDKKMADFETLAAKPDRTDNEDEKLADLLSDLKTLSPLLSPEMYLRFTASQKKLLKPANA